MRDDFEFLQKIMIYFLSESPVVVVYWRSWLFLEAFLLGWSIKNTCLVG